MLIYPAEFYSRKTYVDENALLPGQVGEIMNYFFFGGGGRGKTKQRDAKREKGGERKKEQIDNR